MDIEKLKQQKTIGELLEFGIINLDKPSGPTSFNISDFIREKLKLRKTSHFGTLDPKVTGVLPVALNRACKLTGFFIGEDKGYVGIMKVHGEIGPESIKKVINEKFLGKISQLPPKKSRVRREVRERDVKKFRLIETAGSEILFETEVQGGTYIRKLIDDLGKEVGVGAHMLELRRTRAGIFKEEESVNMYEFEKAADEYFMGNEKRLKAIIIPGEVITELYPLVNAKKEVSGRLLNGSPLFLKDLDKKHVIKDGSKICVFAGDKFIGVYSFIKDKEKFAMPEFVLQPMK